MPVLGEFQHIEVEEEDRDAMFEVFDDLSSTRSRTDLHARRFDRVLGIMQCS